MRFGIVQVGDWLGEFYNYVKKKVLFVGGLEVMFDMTFQGQVLLNEALYTYFSDWYIYSLL